MPDEAKAPSDASPLKRLERPALLKSRFETDWERILQGSPLSQDSNAKDIDAFFADFFCLKPKQEIITKSLQSLTASQTLSKRTSLGTLFRQGISVLETAEKHDSRRSNVLQCFLPLQQLLLSKPFPNYSFDIISILCGSLEQSDAVFSRFVAVLDDILRDPEYPAPLRRRTLQTILVMTCQLGQASLVSYFLRRDFFFTLCNFITEEQHSELGVEAQLLLGVLANYHKFETRNLYLMRLEDLVEEQVMRSMVQRTTRALAKCQQAYIDVEDDTPPSFVATLATFVSSLGLSDFVFSTPPKPTSNTKDKATERAFSGLPPPDVSLLLFPFYDLLHRNKLFVSIIVDEQQRDFLPTLLSFSSYTLCHASTSQRSRHVARLALVTLTLVVEEGTTSVLASDHLAAPVRLCRQRLPQLPYLSDQKRPLLCAILDVVLIFLRHNITKHLDIESHLLAIQLLHKILHGLKTDRMRLKYNWTPIWRALIALGTFITNKFDSLESRPGIDDLVSELLCTLDFACLWSDSLFAEAQDSTMLFYEILRSEDVINKLGDLTGVTGLAQQTTSPRASADQNQHRPSVSATDSVKNLKAVIAHFGTALDEHREAKGTSSLVEADEVVEILARSAERGARLDLVESTNLENVRRYSEKEHDASFKLLLRDAMGDALQITGLAVR